MSTQPVVVAEMQPFARRSNKFLSHDERHALADHLAYNPEVGDLVQGTGGLRKVRWGAEGRGKRGGVRVIYFFGGFDMPLYLLAIYAKNERADLTSSERKTLSSLVRALKQQRSRP